MDALARHLPTSRAAPRMATMMASSAAARGRGSRRINVEARASAAPPHRTALHYCSLPEAQYKGTIGRRLTSRRRPLGRIKGYEFVAFFQGPPKGDEMEHRRAAVQEVEVAN